MATLLQEMDQQRLARRERLRLEVRARLREVLRQFVPGRRVVVFGSLAKPGRFTEISDIDLALESEPAGMSVYLLTSLLAERLGHAVDVVLRAKPVCAIRFSKKESCGRRRLDDFADRTGG